jgi:transcriptional regulator with XRE-family HTH domain
MDNGLTNFDTAGIVLRGKKSKGGFNGNSKAMGRKPSCQPPSWKARVQARMKELKIRQIDIARGLGVTTRGAVGHYFTGRRHMTAEQLVALAKTLKWSVAQVLGEDSGNGARQKSEPCCVVSLSNTELYELLKIYQPCPEAAKPLIRRAFAAIAKTISAEHQ